MEVPYIPDLFGEAMEFFERMLLDMVGLSSKDFSFSKRVVHCRRDSYNVYIGRPSKWGNPFRIGPDGDRWEVIEKYRRYLLNNQSLLYDLPELDGKILGCWCYPHPCHGDVLIELLDKWKSGRLTLWRWV